jgi:RNA polymerase-binding transcription factor DksA
VAPSEGLSEVERAAVRQALVAERAATARRLAALERTFAEMVDAADLEPPDDEHDPEGTTAYERAQVISLAGEARAQLARIDRALASVDEPGAGACEGCGGPIGAERLLALPGTARCVTCAAQG